MWSGRQSLPTRSPELRAGMSPGGRGRLPREEELSLNVSPLRQGCGLCLATGA